MYKMKKCKTCGHDIAKSANKCPYCGANQYHAFLTLFSLAVVFVALFRVFALMSGAAPAGSSNANTVSKEEFEVLYTDMTYSQVVKVIGFDGELASQVDIGGGIGNEYNTEVYTWSNPDGSNMNATFQGGCLVSKAQFGLK